MSERPETPWRVTPAREPETAIAAMAADWTVRRDRGLSDQERKALVEWERSDPRHAAELERLGGAWRWLDGTRGEPGLTALAEDLLQQARARRARRRTVRFALLAGAAAAALAVGHFSREHRAATETIATSHLPVGNYRVLASTVRRVTLPDWSIAELNGASRIEVDFSEHSRRVRLVEGEVHFIVAKNPDRPFLVAAGLVTVRAVGTAFNVRLASATIEVLVTEGTVKLEPRAEPAGAGPAVSIPDQPDAGPALVQGQRATIDREAGATTAVAIMDVGRAEIDETLGWQSTRLVFNNTPLDEVVAGFNRHNRHRLTLGDPKLRTRTLTGVFRADNLDGFVRLLRASVDVKTELRTRDETVLLPAR